jgi:hypothetical protein
MKLTLLISTFLSLSAFANVPTSMSKLVQKLQVTYANTNPDYPIIIMDKDELNWRFLKSKSFGDREDKEKEAKRLEIIAQYSLEKSGIAISKNHAINMDTYLTVLKGSAVALPFFKGYNGDEHLLCAVFHASPNSNQRLETERILGLKTEGVYEDDAYNKLTYRLTFEELQNFSIYHELSHCIDRVFLPAAATTYEPSSHDIHLSESYAESLAMLILAKEGHRKLGTKRAILRDLYSRKMGQYFADNPQNGWGNQLYADGGIIYFLSPVIRNTQSFISMNFRSIKNASIEELKSIAKGIVDENAFSYRSFPGIASLFKNGAEQALGEYREKAFKMPDFFYDAYTEILEYNDLTNYVVQRAFQDEVIEDDRPQEELTKLNIQSLCALVDANNKIEFFKNIEAHRQELKENRGSDLEQDELAKSLNSIFETLQVSCDSKA